MNNTELINFLFQLYDYADYLAQNIRPENNPIDNNNYFMSLIYIEEMMDSYGRGLIMKAAHDDENYEQYRDEAHRRIGILRSKITELRNTYEFTDTTRGLDVIQYKTEKLLRDWPNINSQSSTS